MCAVLVPDPKFDEPPFFTGHSGSPDQRPRLPQDLRLAVCSLVEVRAGFARRSCPDKYDGRTGYRLAFPIALPLAESKEGVCLDEFCGAFRTMPLHG